MLKIVTVFPEVAAVSNLVAAMIKIINVENCSKSKIIVMTELDCGIWAFGMDLWKEFGRL